MTFQPLPPDHQHIETSLLVADAQRAARDLRAYKRLNVIACEIKETTLGWFALAASQYGLCAAHWLADRSMAHRFANNVGWRGETTFDSTYEGIAIEAGQHWVSAALAVIDDTVGELDAPLDLQGTDFQLNVWNALLATRRGERLSYSELAHRLGRPDAVRAVASAVGANPLAVIVPCHRIVGANGQLTGYRWGLTSKSALLQREITNEATSGCYISSP